MNNINTVKQMYDAFGRGDIPAIIDKLDPNVEWDDLDLTIRFRGAGTRGKSPLSSTADEDLWADGVILWHGDRRLARGDDRRGCFSTGAATLTLLLLVGRSDLREIFGSIQMLLQRRQRLIRVCLEICVLRVRGFSLVCGDCLRMPHHHLLDIMMIEGCAL